MTIDEEEQPNWRTLVRRGWRRRCPRCGQGPLFDGWMKVHDQCSHCALELEPSPGATWGFWVVGDRIFIVAALLPIYLGFATPSWWLRVPLFSAIVISFVWTMPQRQGVAIALDYLTRLRWGDPE